MSRFIDFHAMLAPAQKITPATPRAMIGSSISRLVNLTITSPVSTPNEVSMSEARCLAAASIATELWRFATRYSCAATPVLTRSEITSTPMPNSIRLISVPLMSLLIA